MSDFELSYDPTTQTADLVIDGNDISQSDDLEGAVLMSLFLDARTDGIIPDGSTDPRGWWGDTQSLVLDNTGSTLWLLDRSKATTDVISQRAQRAQASLQWLVDDQVATAVAVTATRVDSGDSTASACLLNISITRPGQGVTNYQYFTNWAAQAARSA